MDQPKASLFDAILALETRQDCQKFLEALLTPPELTMIVNRWRVFPLLDKLPQRRIAEQLQVSLGTVSRANRTLKYSDTRCRQILKKLQSPTLSTV